MITINTLIQFGAIFYLLLLLFRYICRKIALGRIKRSLEEGEFIVLEPSFSIIIELLAPLGIGGFIDVLLSVFMPTDFHAFWLNKTTFPFLVITEIISILAILFLSCIKYVVTNRRIIRALAFNYTYKDYYKGIKHIYISNIDHLEIKGNSNLLKIRLKDGSDFNMTPSTISSTKKVKSTIEKYLKEFG